jgi:hypothetical protein
VRAISEVTAFGNDGHQTRIAVRGRLSPTGAPFRPERVIRDQPLCGSEKFDLQRPGATVLAMELRSGAAKFTNLTWRIPEAPAERPDEIG